MQNTPKSRLRSLRFLTPLVPHPMQNQQILLEQILCEIIKVLVFRSQAIGGRNARHAGHLVHVLSIFH